MQGRVQSLTHSESSHARDRAAKHLDHPEVYGPSSLREWVSSLNKKRDHRHSTHVLRALAQLDDKALHLRASRETVGTKRKFLENMPLSELVDRVQLDNGPDKHTRNSSETQTLRFSNPLAASSGDTPSSSEQDTTASASVPVNDAVHAHVREGLMLSEDDAILEKLASTGNNRLDDWWTSAEPSVKSVNRWVLAGELTPEPSSVDRCYHCHKRGHWIKSCPRLRLQKAESTALASVTLRAFKSKSHDATDSNNHVAVDPTSTTSDDTRKPSGRKRFFVLTCDSFRWYARLGGTGPKAAKYYEASYIGEIPLEDLIHTGGVDAWVSQLNEDQLQQETNDSNRAGKGALDSATVDTMRNDLRALYDDFRIEICKDSNTSFEIKYVSSGGAGGARHLTSKQDTEKGPKAQRFAASNETEARAWVDMIEKVCSYARKKRNCIELLLRRHLQDEGFDAEAAHLCFAYMQKDSPWGSKAISPSAPSWTAQALFMIKCAGSTAVCQLLPCCSLTRSV